MEQQPGKIFMPGQNNDDGAQVNNPPEPPKTPDEIAEIDNAVAVTPPPPPHKEVKAQKAHTSKKAAATPPSTPTPPEEDTINARIDPEEEPAESAVLLRWRASENTDHFRSPVWYAGVAAVTLTLAALSFFLSGSWLSSLVVVLAAIALMVSGARQPRVLEYEITDAGLVIDQKEYSYFDFRAFAVVQDPSGSVSIELEPIKRFMPRITVYFNESDGDAIVGALQLYLPGTARKPDIVDTIGRYLKF